MTRTTEPGRFDGISRRTLLRASAVGIGSVGLAGCTSADADTSQGDPTPELDLETLEAETEYGTLQAELAEHSYVGLVGDGRAIGIAFLDDVGGGVDQDSPRGIGVHLYDRGHLAIMIGEVDTEGVATLESEEDSHFDAAVELVMEEDFVTGTVTFEDEDTIPFTAYAAVGGGGVYWAQGTDEESDVSGDWVVLPDGRQWGCICIPPFTSPCCTLHR